MMGSTTGRRASVRNAIITGWGKCVPPAVLTNSDLETVTDTSDDWITTRTGIKERRISHVETSDLSAVAGEPSRHSTWYVIRAAPASANSSA